MAVTRRFPLAERNQQVVRFSDSGSHPAAGVLRAVRLMRRRDGRATGCARYGVPVPRRHDLRGRPGAPLQAWRVRFVDASRRAHSSSHASPYVSPRGTIATTSNGDPGSPEREIREARNGLFRRSPHPPMLRCKRGTALRHARCRARRVWLRQGSGYHGRRP